MSSSAESCTYPYCEGADEEDGVYLSLECSCAATLSAARVGAARIPRLGAPL